VKLTELDSHANALTVHQAIHSVFIFQIVPNFLALQMKVHGPGLILTIPVHMDIGPASAQIRV
jgi:hypothetical protein